MEIDIFVQINTEEMNIIMNSQKSNILQPPLSISVFICLSFTLPPLLLPPPHPPSFSFSPLLSLLSLSLPTQTESRLLGLSSAVFGSSVCLAGKWTGLIAATSGTSVYLLERDGQQHSKK